MTAHSVKFVAQLGSCCWSLAPLVTGLIRTLESAAADAARPALLQPYREIHKLLRKGMVLPDTASWLFSATPYVVFLATLLAGLMVPHVRTAGRRSACSAACWRWFTCWGWAGSSWRWADWTRAARLAAWAAAAR